MGLGFSPRPEGVRTKFVLATRRASRTLSSARCSYSSSCSLSIPLKRAAISWPVCCSTDSVSSRGTNARPREKLRSYWCVCPRAMLRYTISRPVPAAPRDCVYRSAKSCVLWACYINAANASSRVRFFAVYAIPSSASLIRGGLATGTFPVLRVWLIEYPRRASCIDVLLHEMVSNVRFANQ